MREWLITDRRGGFAMGTSQGFRTRKYHSFYAGIPGRAECAFLADWDIRVNDVPLWPHLYSPGVVHPKLTPGFTSEPFPKWTWELEQFAFSLEITPRDRLGGFSYWFRASSSERKNISLRLRPFFALRDLHTIGGLEWRLQSLRASGDSLFEIRSANGRAVYWKVPNESEFHESPIWYRQFRYPVELERGYPYEEDLFSAGEWELPLQTGRGAKPALFEVADDREAIEAAVSRPSGKRATRVVRGQRPEQQFQLFDPPGIVAGFPWFGEWGRDSFIALPGLVMALDKESDETWAWATRLLARWGEWICRVGMIPNLSERGGAHQWESADASLWWAHSLAALWQYCLHGGKEAEHRRSELQRHFGPVLDELVQSIQDGRHLFLHLRDGALHVTEGHATWMDARLDGAPVTPRLGALPEINALWFQARVLQSLWNGNPSREDWEPAARLALNCREDHRSNTVFLHSLPLAPSFVSGARERLVEDYSLIRERFFTPHGLRTLSPSSPGYLSRCEGDQCSRDLAYHQGPAWGWLLGHFRMMEARVGVKVPYTEEFPVSESIDGHRSELYDADAPFIPRGTPAQAWSLACDREAELRKEYRLDRKLIESLNKGPLREWSHL